MNDQTPFNRRTLQRTAIIAAIIAVVGIGLFVALWVLLGQANVGSFPRLILSLCVPPALLALAFGGYALVRRG